MQNGEILDIVDEQDRVIGQKWDENNCFAALQRLSYKNLEIVLLTFHHLQVTFSLIV
ncbi:hypothetical protein NIES22_67550 (plasmid) [Calothrix brevissima NIES-22]|nr:hypothetical protein NIES22_67550 [Calothrix brevissima NIES-22]